MSGTAKRVIGRWRPAASAMGIFVLVATPLAGAHADDGVLGFFQQVFGSGSAPSSERLPQPDYANPDTPPLTVRRQHRRPSGAQVARTKRYTPEELKSVTMYTDKTLVRGDAVMTARGLRIFNGSPSWPHTDDDFVAVSSSDKLPKLVRKELLAIDVASRSDFRGE